VLRLPACFWADQRACVLVIRREAAWSSCWLWFGSRCALSELVQVCALSETHSHQRWLHSSWLVQQQG
jgi:hypothetical protein